MNLKQPMKTPLFCAVLAFLAPNLHAAAVLHLATGASSTPNGDFSQSSNGVIGSNTIISGATTLAEGLTYTSLPTWASGGDDYSRFEGKDASSTVTYTFSTGVDLQGLLLWNYNEVWEGVLYNERGLVSANLTITHSGGTSLLENVSFLLTPETAADLQNSTAELISFGSSFNGVTQIEISNLVNGSADNGWTGFQDIAFVSADPVPEASSLTLLGLGMIGLCTRRRR